MGHNSSFFNPISSCTKLRLRPCAPVPSLHYTTLPCLGVHCSPLLLSSPKTKKFCKNPLYEDLEEGKVFNLHLQILPQPTKSREIFRTIDLTLTFYFLRFKSSLSTWNSSSSVCVEACRLLFPGKELFLLIRPRQRYKYPYRYRYKTTCVISLESSSEESGTWKKF